MGATWGGVGLWKAGDGRSPGLTEQKHQQCTSNWPQAASPCGGRGSRQLEQAEPCSLAAWWYRNIRGMLTPALTPLKYVALA